MTKELTLCTTREIAKIYQVDTSTVRRWVSKGLIKPAVTTPGGHHRFDLTEVDRVIRGTDDGAA